MGGRLHVRMFRTGGRQLCTLLFYYPGSFSSVESGVHGKAREGGKNVYPPFFTSKLACIGGLP